MTHLYNDHVARLVYEARATRLQRQADAARLARSARKASTRPEPEPSCLRLRRRPAPGNPHVEISADRLGEIPTGELTWLAERFHELTVQMYDELCMRRRAEHGVAEIEAMLAKRDGGSS